MNAYGRSEGSLQLAAAVSKSSDSEIAATTVDPSNVMRSLVFSVAIATVNTATKIIIVIGVKILVSGWFMSEFS